MQDKMTSLAQGHRCRYLEKLAEAPKGGILLIHGNSSSSDAFSAQMSDLGQDFHVWSLDLPGHGGSAFGSHEAFTVSNVAEFINTFLKEVILSVISSESSMPFVMVGHSLGGHILMQALARMVEGLRFGSIFGKRHLALCIFGAPPLQGVQSFSQAFLPNELASNFFEENVSPDKIRSLCEQMIYAAESPESRLQLIAALEARFAATQGRFRKELIQSILNAPYSDECTFIQKWLQMGHFLGVLHGEKDPFVSSTYIRSVLDPLFAQGKGLRFEVIKESGHNPHQEKPQEFNSLLREFAEAALGNGVGISRGSKN